LIVRGGWRHAGSEGADVAGRGSGVSLRVASSPPGEHVVGKDDGSGISGLLRYRDDVGNISC